MNTLIYADHAATTMLDPEALEAMMPFLTDQYGNASQPYAFARGSKKALKAARETIAACIGAEPEEIFFTSGGSESDNLVIKGSAFADPEKRAMITSAFEHHAVLHAAAAIERLGYPAAYLRPDAAGVVRPETLDQVITDRTRLVSVMTANNEIGTIQPIRELAEAAHAHGALFHTDAVQAVGHIPIDVNDLGVDMLSASAHKFNGPKGIGFLYVRKQCGRLVSLIDGGSQEHGLRAGTENVAGIVGMATALKKNCDHLTENMAHLRQLEAHLLEVLQESGIEYFRTPSTTSWFPSPIKGEVSSNQRPANTLPGVVSLAFPGAEGEAILHRMDLKGICIATGSACDSRETRISHVLEAIGLPDDLARGTVRISFGVENTLEEAGTIAAALVNVAQGAALLRSL